VPIGAVLVPVQVMLCLVVVTGTALLTRSLRNIESEAPGLDRDHLLLAEVDVSLRGFTGDRFMALTRDVSAAVAAVPGVEAVTYSQNGLFMSRDADAIVAVPGFVGRTADDSSLAYDLVGPGYVHAIGAHLLRGRDVNDRDVSRSPSVAVLNESAARFYFGSVDAVGRVMYFDDGVPTTVVGVVADIRDHSLTAPVDRRAYAAYAQQIAGEHNPAVSFEIKTAGDPATMVMPIRRAIAAADPELPQIDVAPVTTLMRETIRDQRLVATVATAFGIVALLLCLVGLYGVMTYAVTRRTGEIGLRGALGADCVTVLRLVLGDGLRLAAFGLIAGIPLSLAAARALRAQLHGVPATDAVSFAVAVGSLVLCALLAAFVPAARATRVSPAAALAARE
jgi:predicted permease